MKLKMSLLVGVVIAILGALFLYSWRSGFLGRQGFQSGPASSMNQFTMYYADWCPHCQAVKPEFSELAKKGEMTVGNTKCAIRMVNSDENPDEVKRAGVKGFPTFLLQTTEGETVEYKGDRSTDGWLAFINEKLGSK